MITVEPDVNSGEIISVPERSLDASKMEDDKINRFENLVKKLKCKNTILRKRNGVLKMQKMSLAKRCKECKHELHELKKKYGGSQELCSHSSVICVHKELLTDTLKEILNIKKIILKLKPGNEEENVPNETLNVEQPPEVNPASNYVSIEPDTEEITIDLHDYPQDPQVKSEPVEERDIPIENITRDEDLYIPGPYKELRVVLPRLTINKPANKRVTKFTKDEVINSTDEKFTSSTNEEVINSTDENVINSTDEKVTNSTMEKVGDSCDELSQTSNSTKRKVPNEFASDCKALPKKHVTTPKHDKPKAFKCTVAGCGKNFSSKGWFRRHFTTHAGVTPPCDDSIDRRHKCTVDGCGQSFLVKRDLYRHESEHAKETPFACSFDGCSMKFSRDEDLQSHIQSHDQIHDQVVDEVHAGEKPLVCSFDGCDQSFTNVEDREAHICTHDVEKPFKCLSHGCGLRFTNREDRRLHSRTHNDVAEKPYRCSVYGCRQKYATKSKLAEHYRVHSEDEKPFKCPFDGCDRKYSNEYTLECHCTTHPRFYLFTCRLPGCKRKFTKRSVLNKHMKWHEKITKNATIKSDVQRVLDDILDKLVASGDENPTGSDIN